MRNTLVFIILHGLLALVGIVAMIYFDEVLFMFPITLGCFKIFEYTYTYRGERRNV